MLARRRISCRAWELGSLLDWALERAVAAGFASVTVACEPTGHRWRVLDQLAAERGLPLVCVQPLLVGRVREAEDLTWDKSDPVGAAAILAETGDPARFGSPRAVVKHAGLCPRDNASGFHQGKTSISGKGRPALRLAAWRAVWAALPNNPVLAAPFRYLATREHNRLARQYLCGTWSGRRWAAGRTPLRFTGPPGSGKTMPAERLPGVLPELGGASRRHRRVAAKRC